MSEDDASSYSDGYGSDGFPFRSTPRVFSRSVMTATKSQSSGPSQQKTTKSDSDISEVYSLRKILDEAKKHYGDSKPEFCIHDKGYSKKTVLLIDKDDEQTSLTFSQWLGSKLGYWTLRDYAGRELIVKHDRENYYSWRGVNKGFSKEPVAKKLTAPRASIIDVSEMTTTTDPSTRTMRKKSFRQEYPYEMDKTEHELAKKRIRPTEIAIEAAVRRSSVGVEHEISPRGPPPKRKRADSSNSPSSPPRPEKRRLSPSRAVSSVSTASFVKADVNEDEDDVLYRATTICSRFRETKDAVVPIRLVRDMTTADLMDVVAQKWAFILKDRAVEYCVATFSWLDGRSTILLHESNPDGLTRLIEVVRDAPMLKDGKCDVDVEVVV